MMSRTLAAVFISLAVAAPAAAQDAPGEAARLAEALDRVLGAGADLPRPDPVPAKTLTWLPAPLPPWLAAQPYRQQPLFATVPGEVAVGGSTRRRGSAP
jgi:hypothetical protein